MIGGFLSGRPAARRSGFSFVEVIAVVAIMALTLIPFLTYFSQETRNAGAVLGRSVGLDLAYQVMDRLSVEPIQRLAAFEGASGDAEDLLREDPMLALESFSPGYQKMIQDFKFKRHVRFEKSGSGTSCLGILRVKVTWTLPSQNRDAQVSISRVIIDQECFRKARSGILP